MPGEAPALRAREIGIRYWHNPTHLIGGGLIPGGRGWRLRRVTEAVLPSYVATIVSVPYAEPTVSGTLRALLPAGTVTLAGLAKIVGAGSTRVMTLPLGAGLAKMKERV